jgi:activator of HSP90 ATPase
MKVIRQSATFNAGALEVYDALMDSDKHSLITGAKARINRGVGGKFSAFDGEIWGENLILVPGKKIVQSWSAACEGWPRGHFSRVTFTLREANGKTRLSFFQSGVPDGCYELINEGWRESYWEPMKKMLEK